MVFWKQVQKNKNPLPSTLPDLPVSLVLTSLIVVDIIEKLRIYPLKAWQKCKYSFKYRYFLKFDILFTFLLPRYL